MFIPISQISQTVERLYEILTGDLGLELEQRSGVENGLLTLWEMLEFIKNPSPDLNPNALKMYVAGAGIHDLASKIIAVWDDFPRERSTIEPHLRMLAETQFVVQNTPNPRWTSDGRKGRQHDDADKVIELYWACLCIIAGMKVELDDPVHSSGGTNPDVLASASDGTRWGFAIKTLATANPSNLALNLRDRLLDGMRQLITSDAGKGFVVVNLKNVVQHDAIRTASEDGNWRNAHNVLGAQVVQLAQEAFALASSEAESLSSKHPRVAPLVALVAHVTAPTIVDKTIYATELNGLFSVLAPFTTDYSAGSYLAECEGLLWHLNDIVQKVR